MTETLPPIDPARRSFLASWTVFEYAALFVLIATAFGLYAQTRHFEFIDYDDQLYASANRHVLGGLSVDNIKWASTAIVAANWHPVTLYVELILSSLFGPSPGVFHTANAVLHAADVGLLFVFLRYATGRRWPAFFAAALWGWHPLRVESVAWISELKDVLSGFFALSALIAYVHYSRHRSTARYVIVLVLQCLALLSKPIAVSLPALFLLLDYWPLQQPGDVPPATWWGRRVAEKIPFAVLSLADIGYSIVTQKASGAIGSLKTFPMDLRLENAVVSYCVYLRDTIWPVRLGIFYPHPAMIGATIPAAAVAGSFVVLLGITTVCFVFRSRRRYLPVGWLWFMGTLVPVIGLVQIGEQSHADRYTYLPGIGLIILIVWGVSDLVARSRKMAVAASVVGLAAAAFLAGRTFDYAGHWRNSSDLFTRAAEVVPDNYLAMAIEADSLRLGGQMDRGLPIAARAVAIAPRSVGTRISYGNCLLVAGRLTEAATQMQLAVEDNPNEPLGWGGLGDVRVAQAKEAAAANLPKMEAAYRSKAIIDYQQAVLRDPDAYQSLDHLAFELAWTGKVDAAASIWRKLVVDFPAYGPAHGHLADALRVQGDFAAAADQYAAAYSTGERNPEWETNLAWLTATNPQLSPEQVMAVVPVAEDAVRSTGGKDPAPLVALAAATARVGQIDRAVESATTARKLAVDLKRDALVKQIDVQLGRYRQGLSYVNGDK